MTAPRDLNGLVRECSELSRATSGQDRAVEVEAYASSAGIRWTAVAPCRPPRQRDRFALGQGATAEEALSGLAGALRRKKREASS